MLSAELIEQARRYGQEHLHEIAERLTGEEKEAFLRQLRQLSLAELQRLYQLAQTKELTLDLNSCKSPQIIRLPQTVAEQQQHQEARAAGEAALRQGEVAIILVAGGQGTRLGHEAPKGTFPIGPVTDRSLFQIHAEKVVALSQRHGTLIPFLIMTSVENHQETIDFFEAMRWFGLHHSQVSFFTQGMLPALDAATGKVLLKSETELALSPNGHGGVIEALQQAGHLDRLAEQGIKHCFYFQVDNPLVNIADPHFLGHHLLAHAEMSLKVLAKLNASERMGNLVELDGRCRIIEYTELPKSLAEECTSDGQLRIWAGSPAIHLFALNFLQRLASGEIELPYHIARKAVSHYTPSGECIKPEKPNAYKFERFVFDALPLAERVVAMETLRRDEFEPLKNAEGDNSPQSVRQALSDQYARWLIQAGVDIEIASDGHSVNAIEISPLVAMEADDLLGYETLSGLWLSKPW